MDSKLERFLKLIELNEENYSCFFDAKITNVKVSNENKSWAIYIKIKKMIPLKIYEELVSKSEKIKNVKKVYFYFSFEEENNTFNEYFNYYFDILNNYSILSNFN